ncbi:Cutinase [Pyrenophora tritici-repentis]|nr:Cutinase [Pyrenophora tritici-repentis]
MKFASLVAFAALAAASPISPAALSPKIEVNVADIEVELQTRQLGLFESTSNDLLDGKATACPKVIFIFARASGEVGNMGLSTGPAVATTLRSKYGEENVWVQGVGGPYTAYLFATSLPDGTTQESINEAIGLFQLANKKCPGTPIVAGGYSQGTAVVAGAVSRLPRTIRNQIKGIVLFGYTLNLQNGGAIYRYPSENLKVFCGALDLVCQGYLIESVGHFFYYPDSLGPAPEFLESKIDRYYT